MTVTLFEYIYLYSHTRNLMIRNIEGMGNLQQKRASMHETKELAF